MKFRETLEKEIGCQVGKCTKYHLSCCYNCPESEGCQTKCELFILHEAQPLPLEERRCKHLTDAKILVLNALLRRESIL